MAVRGRLHVGATRWFCAEQAKGVARPAEWWFAVSFDRTWSDWGADVRGNRRVNGRKPSSQLAEWSGGSFPLSTDCGVCAARAVDQACPLSEYRTSVSRIERNIENLLATPGEKQCHLNRTGNVIETLRLDKTPEAYARMMEGKWLSMPSAGKRSTI